MEEKLPGLCIVAIDLL